MLLLWYGRSLYEYSGTTQWLIEAKRLNWKTLNWIYQSYLTDFLDINYESLPLSVLFWHNLIPFYWNYWPLFNSFILRFLIAIPKWAKNNVFEVVLRLTRVHVLLQINSSVSYWAIHKKLLFRTLKGKFWTKRDLLHHCTTVRPLHIKRVFRLKIP